MVISASIRTDIPAFYPEWFMNRIREGFVVVRNPYYPESIMQYSLNPDVVDAIEFTTKNPGPMLKHLSELKPFNLFWCVTITPYGKDVEPCVPDKEVIMQNLITLSKILGKNHVSWFYSPVFVSERYTVDHHISAFTHMCETLDGYVETCHVDFINIYEKVKRNFPEVRAVTEEEQTMLIKQFIAIAKSHGITIKACPSTGFGIYGADVSGCQTAKDLEKITGYPLKVPKRSNAGFCSHCIPRIDIGEYNTCYHLCRYCYANADCEDVKINMENHDPFSPLLIGRLIENEVPHIPKQKSWKAVPKGE